MSSQECGEGSEHVKLWYEFVLSVKKHTSSFLLNSSEYSMIEISIL